MQRDLSVRSRSYSQGSVRLRALSEAECYTRCYGGRPGERVSVVKILSSADRREAQARRRARIERREQAA